MENLQEIKKELQKIEGKVKAEVIFVQKDYIIYKEGEEGLEKLMKKLEEMDVFFDFKKVKPSAWVDEWINSLILVTAKNIFNWTEEDIFQMGRHSPRASFFIKSMMQYIVSLEVMFKNANTYWKKQQDFGEVEAVELNNDKKYAIVRIKDFKTNPLVCIYHAGYFQGAVELSVKSEKVTVEETKCRHRGDEYDEFLIKW